MILNVLNASEIRNLVLNELRKRDKIISKGELDVLVRNSILSENKSLYKELDKLRRRINDLEAKNVKL